MNKVRNNHLKFLLSVIALCWGIQGWMLAVILAGPRHWPQIFYYLVFVFAAGASAWVVRYRQPKSLALFALVESTLTALLICAAVQAVFYDYHGVLARRALGVLMTICVLNKLAWARIDPLLRAVYALAVDVSNRSLLRIFLKCLGLALVFLLINVPSPQDLLAHMYVGEQFHHHDIFVLAPGWAAYKGHVMDVDHISQYGVGMPMVFAWINRLMGGFSHEHVLSIIMTGTMIYYAAFFIFAGLWLRSWLLAVIVLLLGMRVQMFHPGVYPFVLTYPSATVIRYFFDILFFLLLGRHLKDMKTSWLLAAGVLSGWAVFYMDSTGLFLAGAFYFYLLMLWVRGPTRPAFSVLALACILPPACAGVLFYSAVGPALFTHAFWGNFLETVDYFLSGIGTYPMNESFKYHNFGAGSMGFVIPVVYVWTILWAGGLWLTGQCSRWHILVVVWAMYGLGLNHYYIARSLLTSYYVSGLPLMIVAGYWIKMLVTRLSPKTRYPFLFAGLMLSAYALLTNHLLMSYPNRVNLSRNPLIDPLVAQPLPADLSSYFFHISRKDPENLKMPLNSLGEKDEEIFSEAQVSSDGALKGYYLRDFDFSRDAALIDSLTKPQERVALISDFEVKILMQADRGPFFYYFPLISSRPKHMRTLPMNFLHTGTDKFNQTAIGQIAGNRPRYVFLEKIFLQGPAPGAYLAKAENVWPIVQYVLDRYRVVQTGEYIAALERKDR